MGNELVPVEASVVDRMADERELMRRRAEAYAVRWLHGYTSAHTRNGYGVDIGLSPEVRAELPGGPASSEPAPEWAWIPWALDHGLDPAGKLTKQDAEAYAHGLKAVFPDKNVRRRRWAALCAFYRSLRVEGVVACDPGEMVNRRTMGLSGTDPSATLPLHPAQVRALYLAASLASRNRSRHRAMLAVLASTGCRAAELVGIDLDDYQPQVEGHALVRLDGKGSKQRWVMLPAADTALLEEYLEVREPSTRSREVAIHGQATAPVATPLFTTGKGKRVHVSGVTQMLRALAATPRGTDPRPEVRAAARVLAPIVDSLHPHQLRHTYAVTAEEAGVPLSQVQADLGHASLATTQTYLHARDAAAHSAARTVSAIYHANQEERQL